MDGWGKIKAAAKYAGSVTPRTVKTWFPLGLVYSQLPSGTILIKYSDIDEFLKRFAVGQQEDESTENFDVKEIVEQIK